MQTSDFLTILGLVLAIWAFIPSKERRFILLFFSNFEIGLLFSALFVIHYLMSFDWIKDNWFPSLSAFTIKNGIPSTIWAYIFALATIIYPIIKFSFGYFSSSRLRKLIALYETYLKENEIDLLVSYINKYHINDIKKYLQGVSNLPQKESIDILLRKKTEHDNEYDKLIKPARIRFASWVYGYIIKNETFINKAANKYPELFATAFSGMETKAASNEELVKLFIQILFENKNQLFVQELKIMNNTRSSILEINSNVEIPILFSILGHTKVASANQIWYPVGEETIKSLKHDRSQTEFLIKKYDSDLKEELWNYKVYISIVYFNYMVRETIYRESDWHMWLFYFRSIIKLLINIIPTENEYNVNSEYPSFTHYIIHEEFSIMVDWLDLSKEQENDNQVIDTIRCLGECIHSVCQAEISKISVTFRRNLLDMVLRTYFEFSHYPNNIGASTSREWLEKMFINPKGVDFGIPETTDEYLAALQDAWDEFDKVPYEQHEDNGSIQQFVVNVITPLALTE